MNPNKWLAMTDEELAVEAAKVLVPEPWKHDIKLKVGKDCVAFDHCLKCKKKTSPTAIAQDSYEQYTRLRDFDCSVPDAITLDWNTAMEWFRKAKPLASIVRRLCGPSWISATHWMLTEAQPTDYIRAACMAMEDKI